MQETEDSFGKRHAMRRVGVQSFLVQKAVLRLGRDAVCVLEISRPRQIHVMLGSSPEQQPRSFKGRTVP